MKEKFRKFQQNSFFNYLRSVNVGNILTAKNTTAEGWLLIVSTVLTACVLHSMSTTISDRSVSGTFASAWVLYGICLMCGYNRRKKPSAFNLMPIGYRKRVVWSFLANLVFYVAAILIWVAFIVFIILFIALITFFAGGGWILTVEESAAAPVALGVQGYIFDALMFLFLFGAGMSLSYIGNKMIRYLSTVGFPLLLEIFALLLIRYSGNFGGFIPMGNVIENFENLPCSVAWLVSFGVIALVTLAGAIIIALKNEKPKEF